MQAQVLQFEAQASDRRIIGSYQEKYLESANRVRVDIESENKKFNTAVNQLSAQCLEIHNKQKQAEA